MKTIPDGLAARTHRALSRARSAVGRFRDDVRGIGAIEFALVAPVLILLYIGAAEISVAMSIDKKVARAAETVGDLVTRQDSVDQTYLKTMNDVVEAVMTPYTSKSYVMQITGIRIQNGDARVAWSWNQDGKEPFGKGSAVDVPDDLIADAGDIPNGEANLVRARVSVQHGLMMPGAADLDLDTLTLGKTYYLRPRQNIGLACTNC
ncbi:TadE/TadG family type IV pilus assembly protein [Pararhizobium mangrovi]|nr:TadE/TadG family type IV pilus assembly protein [Pararhizobium mangrovi]